jgi:hypothetical protein
MTTRRNVLTVLGLGAVAAAGGAGALQWRQGQLDAAATAAWRAPGAGRTDPRLHALAHAILAPNPHNRQPWQVALDGTDAMRLYIDLDRLLPATDPPGRQIVIGCGAFLELLDLAARENGHRAEITPWPDGDPGQTSLDLRPFAHVRLVADPGVARDPLAAHILARRTNREPFDLAREPSAQDLAEVLGAGAAPGLRHAASHTDAVSAAQLRDLVWRGWALESRTPTAMGEHVTLMRIGKGEIAKHRDGISLDFPFVDLLRTLGQVTPDTLRDPDSAASAEGARMWRAMADTAPAFVWTLSEGNSRALQLQAGRAYARMNLAATARGLAMHPWSMTLQEYSEMAALYRETQVLLGARADLPLQMLSRIGYAPPVPPAPRRGLEAHLRA